MNISIHYKEIMNYLILFKILINAVTSLKV